MAIIDKVWRHCEKAGVRGRTVTLKLRYQDFEQLTRSRSLHHALASREELERISFELLDGLFPMAKGVRLLGVTLSSLEGEDGEAASGQMQLAF